MIWIPFYGNSQGLQLDNPIENQAKDSIRIQQDSLGFYYRVPFAQAQVAVWKSQQFPLFLDCKKELRGITSQYLEAQRVIDSINYGINNLVVNNDYLSLSNATKSNEIEILQNKLSRSKFWSRIKDGVSIAIITWLILK